MRETYQRTVDPSRMYACYARPEDGMLQPYRRSNPEQKLPKLHRLLIATNFDATSEAAIEMGAALAYRAAGSCSIHLICVLEALMYTPWKMAALSERDPDLHPEVTHRMAKAVQHLREYGIESIESSIEFGIAADVIVRYVASGKFDVLILGRGEKASTAAHVMARTSIPVLTVRAQPLLT
jgi:nucleotide-binding universal stress UspA family protein